jgi:hypothetical protein
VGISGAGFFVALPGAPVGGVKGNAKWPKREVCICVSCRTMDANHSLEAQKQKPQK